MKYHKAKVLARRLHDEGKLPPGQMVQWAKWDQPPGVFWLTQAIPDTRRVRRWIRRYPGKARTLTVGLRVYRRHFDAVRTLKGKLIGMIHSFEPTDQTPDEQMESFMRSLGSVRQMMKTARA